MSHRTDLARMGPTGDRHQESPNHDRFRSSTLRPARWEIVGFVGSLALFMLISLLVISQGSPLGHDEAVYATRARQILNGEPASGWWLANRAPGLPLLLTLAWIGSGTEPHLRFVVVLCGGLLLLTTWLLGRLMIGRRAAMVAAYGMAVSPVIVMSASHVWPDVPGAAFGMAAMCVYAYGLISKRFRWWMVGLVIGLVALATVIRYGAPIPIGIGLVGLTLWRWPAGRRRKVRVAVSALGVGAVLAFIVLTPVITGASSPVDAFASDSAHNPRFGGFGDYWGLREQVFAGSTLVGLVAAAIGLLGVATSRALRREFLIPFAVLVGTFVALATFVHGEVRYLSPVIPWLWLCAGAALAWRFSSVPKPAALALAVGVVVVLGVFAQEQADSTMEFNKGFTNVKEAAATLSSDSECAALTSLLHTPQVEWYSGCETSASDLDEAELQSRLSPDGTLYLLIVDSGERPTQGVLTEEYLTRTAAEPIDHGNADSRFPLVEIWRLSG